MLFKWTKFDTLSVSFIVIIALLLILPMFLSQGQLQTFDGPVHLNNIAMFYRGLLDGDFPVQWADGFANYGHPAPIFIQQTTSYLGAFLTFITKNVLLSYTLVHYIGAVLSTLFLYIFLRVYTRPQSALIAVTLFNFAPYRIINIYTRGAVPEFFASVFVPLLLIGCYLWLEKKNFNGLIITCLSSALLILTHPFVFVISQLVTLPYIFSLVIKHKSPKRFVVFSLSYVLGMLLAGYFIIPLLLEIKYLFYASDKRFLSDHFLSLKNYFHEAWYYFYKNDIHVRGHYIHGGLIEITTIIIGIVFLIKQRLFRDASPIFIFTLSGFAIIILSLSVSTRLFEIIPVIGGIQHQWRLMSAYIFIAPLVLSFLLDRHNEKPYFLLLILAIVVMRSPQLYVKNPTRTPESNYFFTKENLHGDVMNSVWMGRARDYPVKKNKIGIIEGSGSVLKQEIGNSIRNYTINAKSTLRIADYTFYFPGWNVYVDGENTNIQFQDPAYRGVITYLVPPGTHHIQIKFEQTKIRKLGQLVSIFGILTLVLCTVFRKKLSPIIS